jgi:ATP-binding cassette subfamily B protein
MRCWACDRENQPGVRFCAQCGAGLACPDCGAPMTAAQRFCTRCGRRLPLRGAQTSIRRITQRVQETPHFRIHYPTESFAEQQLGAIADRLETAYAALAGLLGIDVSAPRQIDVHLSEMLEDPNRRDVPVLTGGYHAPRRPAIYEVYRPDAPGVALERSLVQVLLEEAVGPDATLPPFAQEGIYGWIGMRMAPENALQAAQIMGQIRARGRVPPISDLVSGPPEGLEPVYGVIAGTMTGFLVDRYGFPRFLDFVNRAPVQGVGPAVQAAFGTSLKKLEKGWEKSFRGGPSGGGITRFFKTSLPYLKPHRLKVAEILVYIGLAIAFTTLFPLSQKWLIDRAIVPGITGQKSEADATEQLLLIMGGITALFVVASVTGLRENYLSAWVAEKVLQTIRIRIFTKLQRMEPGFFQRIQTGDIMSRLTNDLQMVQYALTGAMAQGLQMVLTLIVALCTIFYLDWKLALFAVAGMPLFFLTTKFLGPPAARASFERQQDAASMTSNLQENLLAQPVVKAFGLEDRASSSYGGKLDQFFRSSIRLSFLSSIYGLTANSIASAIQLTILGLGGWLIIRGDMTLGSLMAFLSLMAQLIGPVQGLSGILQTLQQATGSMDRVEELLKMEPSIANAEGARPIPPVRHAIRMEHVTFSYTGAQPNLQEFSIEIPAGAKVAFVGPSGCGKSTTLNLIMRFYDPQQGRVTFDGVDLREATLESVRGQMGVVFQDNFLFDTSIRENIRMGRLGATDAEIVEAAKAAEIHELIVGMPMGYDTPVGERGGQVSGGQRQRIAIARAILRNPAILLLDEATSALDPRTEAAINKTLDRLSAGRTTIAVTHRLTSAAQMDRIFVLDKGHLVEQGTHDELVRRDGLYARLWQEQTGGVTGPIPTFGGQEALRLMQVPLFAGLDGDVAAALANRLAVERYAPGSVIVNEGERGTTMYIVDRGTAEVLVQDTSGQRKLADLRAGDYFGEMALLYDVPRTATVRATSPLQVLSLSREDLDELLEHVPELRGTLEESALARAGAIAQVAAR